MRLQNESAQTTKSQARCLSTNGHKLTQMSSFSLCDVDEENELLRDCDRAFSHAMLLDSDEELCSPSTACTTPDEFDIHFSDDELVCTRQEERAASPFDGFDVFATRAISPESHSQTLQDIPASPIEAPCLYTMPSPPVMPKSWRASLPKQETALYEYESVNEASQLIASTPESQPEVSQNSELEMTEEEARLHDDLLSGNISNFQIEAELSGEE